MPEPQVLLNPITEEKGFNNFPGLICHPSHHLKKKQFFSVEINLSTMNK